MRSVAQKGFRFIFRNTHRSYVCLVLYQMLASWQHGVRSWGRWGFCLEEFSFLFEGAGVAWKRLARSDAPLSRRVLFWVLAVLFECREDPAENQMMDPRPVKTQARE